MCNLEQGQIIYERKGMGELETRRKERTKIKGKNESMRPLRMLTFKNACSV
jgi:hypothetical protein